MDECLSGVTSHFRIDSYHDMGNIAFKIFATSLNSYYVFVINVLCNTENISIRWRHHVHMFAFNYSETTLDDIGR